jgi:hypothetical protein
VVWGTATASAIRLYWETIHCDPSLIARVRWIEGQLPA